MLFQVFLNQKQLNFHQYVHMQIDNFLLGHNASHESLHSYKRLKLSAINKVESTNIIFSFYFLTVDTS